VVTGGLGIGGNGTERTIDGPAEDSAGGQRIDARYTRAVSTVAAIAVAVVAVIHVYILVLEMFLWTTPRGLRSFGIDQEFANRSATLAANQGLYNGFLAAGLIAGLLAPDPVGFAFKVFFLGCVIVAGLYGAATVSRRILVVQTVPAVIGLALVLLAGTST
jgi:putative membrane protein